MTSINASILAVTGFYLISSGLLLLILSFYLAKQKKYRLHKNVMILAVSSNIAFLVLYVYRFFTEGETHFEGPDKVRLYVYFPLLIIHISFAIISIYFVGKQIIKTYKGVEYSETKIPILKNEVRTFHRKNGKTSMIIWGSSFIGGIITFIMLYILY